MTLTKKIKDEVQKVYQAYWNSYLAGDSKTFASCLDDSYWLLGTTQEEVFTSKAATMKWYKNTKSQIVGKVELRDRKIAMKMVGTGVIVHEACNIFALSGKQWIYYAPLRLTTTLQSKRNRWKVVQQHGSLPDTKADAGETLGLEKIKAENLELREAVKRRTIELESKNRELEIEAAMEKVRVRSLAMQKPEELADVAEVLRNEMGALGVEELETSSIYILDDAKGTTECWYAIKDIRTKGKKLVTDHMTLRLDETWVGHQMNKFHRSKQTRTSILMKGKNRTEWINYCAGKSSVLQGYYGGEIPERTYHLVKFSNGFMGAASPGVISNESWDLLQRATVVFSFAYKRFSDLQKAEAQAREAKIEAALERVRAQTMAMHSSEDVGKCVVKMFAELTAMGVDEGTRFGIGILNQDNENNQLWTAKKDGAEVKLHIGNLDMTSHPLLISARKAWKEQIPFHKYVLEGEDLLAYYRMLNTAPDYKIQIPLEKLPEKEIQHCFIFEHGFFYAFSPREFQPDLIQITKRFSSLFEQTYRRYLDLERAEAQAREAQIEAALERVRSRSMAMHKSEELREVLQLIFEQLCQLNFNIDSAQFSLNYKESDDLHVWTAIPGQPYPTQQFIPYFKNPILDSVRQAKESNLTFFSHVTTIEEKNEFFQHFFNHVANVPEERKKYILERPGYARSIVFLDDLFLGVQNYSGVPFTESENQILIRFGKVFEQSYTRFLDLQKAEAQAREAQIEAALERVRAHAMGLRKSGELETIITVIFEELQKLGLTLHECSIFLRNGNTREFTVWGKSTSGNDEFLTNFQFYFVDHPLLNAVLRDLDLKIPYREFFMEQGELKSYADLIFSIPAFKDSPQEYKDSFYSLKQVYAGQALFQHGFLEAVGTEPLPGDLPEVLKRFSQVIDLTYTRFLDLQKAEAQAREAQIEAALERVRSRSMAMHKSDELNEVIAVLYEQLQLLQVGEWGCSLNIYNKTENYFEIWLSTDTQRISPQSFRIEGQGHQLIKENWDIWKSQEQFRFIELKGQVKVDYDEYVMSQTGLKYLPAEIKRAIKSLPESYASIAAMNHGTLNSYSGQNPLSKDDFIILQRFAKVFEQSYTRFLDLQKAEAQAREAQIEAAMERVRSRSMAMHKSEELLSVITVVSEQLQHLNFKFNTVSFAINNQAHDYTFWFAIMGDPNPIYIQVPYIENPMFDRLKDVQAKGADFYTDTLTPDENKQWHEHVFAYADIPSLNEETRAYILRSGYARSIAIKPSIMLVISNYAGQPYSEDQNEIIKRFATVFEQSYTRFLDLQKAEAQAREAQIEAALERVRSRSLAMHKSEELQEVVNTVSAGLVELGVKMDSSNFNILHEGSRDMDLWVANIYSQRIHIPYIDLKPIRDLMDARDKGINSLQVACTYEEKNLFWNEAFERTGFKAVATAERKKYILESKCWTILWTLAKHCGIQLNSYSRDCYTEEEVEVMKRFTNVFEQAYVRFLDLQKAEVQAKEAVKQSSLDRVRGEIASMRTTADLDRITPLIWKELTTLGIAFIRCGVFIMDEKENKVHTYLSTPDGRAIAAFHTPMDDSGSLAGAIEHWQQQKVFVTHWVDSDFQVQADILLKQGSITSREQYLTTLPKEGFHLHFLPFRQGMLYVGSHEQLPTDVLQLVQSLADAFSVAYARYEDFTKLESAKQQIEKTLTDLKQTQKQLIQSEKMASLGELTAGIAHEIQNPLNFVNNFSEVSNELIKEIQDIRHKTQDQGNKTEEDEILNDIASNLEKINHHGKRAADIVKGMLQHSRSSSGVKEPTDINALADEYLRLAYHGLRAKDKSFNANMKTDFDKTIGNINIIPQDIGRVILNLITNAFYVVNEKSKHGIVGYEPTVSVSTKKVDNKVLVSIKDNGNGIADSIKEKIFQPFFTTKPTGQGTGLGLSLSYDIVKAHGGELTVMTTANIGSEFIITLPM